MEPNNIDKYKCHTEETLSNMKNKILFLRKANLAFPIIKELLCPSTKDHKLRLYRL